MRILNPPPWARIALLLFMPWVIYAASIPGEFVYDDVALTVLENPLLLGEASLFEALLWDRPLREFTYLIDHALWGFNPAGYHIQNILWHTANGLLVYFLLLRIGLSGGLAFATALLFSVHPINVESVAWISGRKELLCLFFQLLSIYAFLGAFGCERRVERRAYALSLAAAALALMSKQTAVILPALLLIASVLRFFQFSEAIPWRRLLLWITPHIALVFAFTLFHSGVIERLGYEFQIGEHFDPGARGEAYTFLSALLTPLATLGRSLYLCLLPLDLTIEHAYPPVLSIWDARWLLGAFSLALGAALAWRLRRDAPAVCAGLVWFAAAWAPTSGALPITYLIAERYLYVPAVGYCLAIVALTGYFLKTRPQWIAPALIAATLLLGVRAVDRVFDWRDELTLWTSAVESRPQAATAWFALGNAHEQAGNVNEARTCWNRALKIDPKMPQVWLNIGIMERQRGDFAAAEEAYRRALEIQPRYGMAYYNLGILYEELEEVDKALECYREAARTLFDKGGMGRRNGIAHYQAARLLAARGDLNAARSHLAYAERLAPRFAPMYLLKAQIASPSRDAARDALQTALRLDPEFAEAYFHLGALELEAGRPQSAQAHWSQAVQLDASFRDRIDSLQKKSP